MAGGGDKTEKATPKKRDDARKKGQVAKSMDLNGAVVLLAALLALSAFAPGMLRRISEATRQLLMWTAQPEIVGPRRPRQGVLHRRVRVVVLAGPDRRRVPGRPACSISIAQVGFKPSRGRAQAAR